MEQMGFECKGYEHCFEPGADLIWQKVFFTRAFYKIIKTDVRELL